MLTCGGSASRSRASPRGRLLVGWFDDCVDEASQFGYALLRDPHLCSDLANRRVWSCDENRARVHATGNINPVWGCVNQIGGLSNFVYSWRDISSSAKMISPE